jgi:hypothetical protein
MKQAADHAGILPGPPGTDALSWLICPAGFVGRDASDRGKLLCGMRS